ncbi:hypothetical protein [Rhodococcus jostii]|uniref:hypothetical protein n=1 Tax=Rhodococcus jostii TaxID=132919 RepID=UPI00398257AA
MTTSSSISGRRVPASSPPPATQTPSALSSASSFRTFASGSAMKPSMVMPTK